ncbi:hypothetical protein BCY86_02885 [Pajaroellobacter abortibovis]|uniref:DUF58 domain-containing protein n=2 Tax=Pajaroellobacter abortibovis TaxID=1882918 RepID=A0A1L6MZ40_9BACT|nr:hypothetical protein BCY86_02885 [Pajaroellobacter abortibovis]
MILKELLSTLRTIRIHTARLANENLCGQYVSSFKGQGLAFREVRPYQMGDDVRAIDWNVSARMNEPFVKVFTEEREMTVMLVVDLSASEQFGTYRVSKLRLASEVSALIAFSAIWNNDRIGLILGAQRVHQMIAPKKGDKHVMRLIREILGFEPPSPLPQEKSESAGSGLRLGFGTDLKASLEALVRVSHRRSVAFLISDFFAQDYEKALALAAANHDIIPVVLTDKRERELPPIGLITLEDLESGTRRVVDSSDTGMRQAYQKELESFQAGRRRLFKKLGLDFVEIDTAGSFVRPLRDLFARRAGRVRR